MRTLIFGSGVAFFLNLESDSSPGLSPDLSLLNFGFFQGHLIPSAAKITFSIQIRDRQSFF